MASSCCLLRHPVLNPSFGLSRKLKSTENTARITPVTAWTMHEMMSIKSEGITSSASKTLSASQVIDRCSSSTSSVVLELISA